LRRRLKEAGIQKWKAVDRPLLTKKQAAQRFEWAKAHRHWDEDMFAKVAWSDESAVQRDCDPRQVWVFRRQNKCEKYDPRNVRGKSKGGCISQMIWGCFVGNKLGPIVFINGSVNTQVYINILTDSLLPFIDALNAGGITDVVFQQDNATPHSYKKTRQWLADAAREHGFLVMEWPPNSPDMNPIEHLWGHLKLELNRRFPDTSALKGSPDAIRRVLTQRLTEVWWAIGNDVLNRLTKSMPHRVQALLKAKGWYTDY